MTIQQAFLYGTAWKEERTEALVSQALAAGFTGFDTANQRKHYYEEGVGRALAPVLAAGRRAELFLQTKFTYQRGQDHRLPYDAAADVATQVRQSFASSLQHLGVTHLDSYLLHGPEMSGALSANDWKVWRTMEELQQTGATRVIGVSNVSAAQIDELVAGARVKPTYVQNRCYVKIDWDRASREACKRHGIIYQGFNLIADPLVWSSPVVARIAERHGGTVAQVVYRWAMRVGMLPLTGTKNALHMAEALASPKLDLAPEETLEMTNLNRGA